MKSAFVLLALLLPTAAPAAEHACAADAREQARDKPVHIEDAVVVLRSIPNPAARKQRFDVLELRGHLYRSRYRIRMIYAQVPGACQLMGQEILEHAQP